MATVVCGLQWGDEGKGKIIDLLAKQADIVVRPSGGANAGHCILINNQEVGLHLIPSGIFNEKVHCHLAPGVMVDPELLIEEIAFLQRLGIPFEGRFTISPRASIVLNCHRLMDQLFEKRKGNRSVGTTGKGIGPAVADKVMRIGLLLSDLSDEEHFKKQLTQFVDVKNQELEGYGVGDELIFDAIYIKLMEWYEKLKPYIYPLERTWDKQISQGKKILVEGAQGTLLDLMFGTYPYVTSTVTTASGITAAAGMSPFHIKEVMGILKVYQTRVGNGPFPTELEEAEQVLFPHANTMREIGVTTGRKRRIGWFDGMLARYAVQLNGVTKLALTKLDILDQLDTIKLCVGYELHGKQIATLPENPHDLSYVQPLYETFAGWKKSTRGATQFEDLPRLAKVYIERIQELCGVPLQYVSTGPEREEILVVDGSLDSN